MYTHHKFVFLVLATSWLSLLCIVICLESSIIYFIDSSDNNYFQVKECTAINILDWKDRYLYTLNISFSIDTYFNATVISFDHIPLHNTINCYLSYHIPPSGPLTIPTTISFTRPPNIVYNGYYLIMGITALSGLIVLTFSVIIAILTDKKEHYQAIGSR